WMAREFSEGLGDDLGAVTLPALDNGETPNSFVGVKSYMVSYYSENKEWSEDLMEFLTNEENALLYYDVAGEMPAHEGALNDEIIASEGTYSVLGDKTEYGEAMTSDPAVQRIGDASDDALTSISVVEPVDEVLEEAVISIKENIQASGAGEQ